MPPTDEARRRQCAREAALRLHHALCTLRQHPHHTVLCRAAVRRCTDAMLAATAEAPLRLQLADGAVATAGEDVFPFALHEPPFGPLRTAGIGELVLPRGVAAEAVERLLQALAASTWTDDPTHDPAAALCAAAPEVHLRAATFDQAAPVHGPRADWWLLPPPAPVAGRLQAAIERALHGNLAAQCARLLVADLDARSDRSSAVLEPLFASLLQRGDLATAAWLLEQIGHHPNVPPTTVATLQDLARSHCDEAWLRDRLRSLPREQLLDLLALVMQLGDETATRLRRIAGALQHPLAGWFDELLGPR
ncbi:MAG: hypothetical protein KF830_09310 [Planctomycetes bacterium]|nr:hypothetical protein [Planctomycetota bacterium]